MTDIIKQQIYLGPNFGMHGIPVVSVDSGAIYPFDFDILYKNTLDLKFDARFGDIGHEVDRRQDPDERDWVVDQKYGSHPYRIAVVNGLNPRADTMLIYVVGLGKKFISDINFNNVSDYLLVKVLNDNDIKVIHNITQLWRNWNLRRGTMFLNK